MASGSSGTNETSVPASSSCSSSLDQETRWTRSRGMFQLVPPGSVAVSMSSSTASPTRSESAACPEPSSPKHLVIASASPLSDPARLYARAGPLRQTASVGRSDVDLLVGTRGHAHRSPDSSASRLWGQAAEAISHDGQGRWIGRSHRRPRRSGSSSTDRSGRSSLTGSVVPSTTSHSSRSRPTPFPISGWPSSAMSVTAATSSGGSPPPCMWPGGQTPTTPSCCSATTCTRSVTPPSSMSTCFSRSRQ